MHKEKKVLWVLVTLVLLSMAVSVLGVYFFLQRDNAVCEATANFQNTERRLWLNVIEEFASPESDLGIRFPSFIDENLPEVRCVRGKLVETGNDE